MAAEAVAGALLSALLDTLVNRLASPEVLNFFRGGSSAAELLDKLNITLLSANALLNDAEDRQVKDSNIKSWVDILSHVLSEADNVVDEINTEAMRREIKEHRRSRWNARKILKKLLRKDNNSSSAAFDKETNEKIEKIIGMLKFLLDQKDYIGLKEGVQSKRLERTPASLIGDPSDVLGRNHERDDIVKLLLSENNEGSDEKVSVVPIVGMGGVGKTTLARLVYDDNSVKHHFELKAWVTVSDDFDVFKLAKQALEGFTGENSEVKEEEDSLKRELEKILRGKKFLLVLDDVWNENYALWNKLKSCLQFGAEESKIIVTTRNETIGSKMGSVPSHRLNGMFDEDCWQLFTKHAFHNIEPNVCRDLEETGRAIVKNCKGLPLAVMSLAGLLCSVSNKNEWEAVLNSDVWDLHEKGNDEIIPSLWLSYSYLPSHLKRCFAYCSIFPKNYKYDKKRIILLWMAEGLLLGENMEDVGEEYIKTLISRSLFQRSAETESSFVMHDRVHDLAAFVSGKGFCVRLNDKDNDLEHSLPEMRRYSSLTNKTRHLLYEDSFPEMENFKGLSEAKCLRTLMPWGRVQWYHDTVNSEVVVKKFRCLRVLRLSSAEIKKVTKSIGKLKHLRYLDLSYNTAIKRLPDSICTLYNLQTLLLNGCRQLTELPTKMGNLVKLRHLGLSKTDSLKRLPDAVCRLKNLHTLLLNGCREPAELPANMGGLLNLRHLDLSETYSLKRLPDAVCSLKNLQTLLLNGCWCLTELPANMGSLLNLRHLDLRECRELTELPANMGSLLNLRHLDLSACYGLTELPANMGRLLNLRHLDLHGCTKLTELPANMGSLLNLRHLDLRGCTELTELPANMGSLLNLRHLDLSGCWSLTELPANMGSLLNLRHLDLSGCWSLTELPANMGSLLNLRHLHLRETYSLKRMPLSNWNLKGLRTLTKLVLNDEHSGSKIKELKELSDGSFEIVGLENVVNPKDVLEAEFEKKSGITEITLKWSSSRSNFERDRATLDAFKPHVSLKELNIINYGGTELSDWVGDGSLTNLQFLDISYTKELQRWSLEGVAFRCLKKLKLRECPEMEVLSCGQMNTTFPSLVKLEIVECPKLEITGLPLPSSLEKLCINNDCEKLMAQRMQWGLLTTSLKELTIAGCKDFMDTFPEEGLLPTTLLDLSIMDAPNMKALNGNAFQHLTSLTHLHISDCPKLECLPEQGLPASLTDLTIWECPKLESLPEQGLPASLTDLIIWECPKLESLPEPGLPASLTFLQVYRCPQLEERLQRETGQDWHKISHIPTIFVGGEEI